jgi:hypothetical protein
MILALSIFAAIGIFVVAILILCLLRLGYEQLPYKAQLVIDHTLQAILVVFVLSMILGCIYGLALDIRGWLS